MSDSSQVTLSNPSSGGNPGDGHHHRRRLGVFGKLRTYLLTGILVTAPFALTVYLGWLFIEFVDGKITPLIPPRYNPETYLPFGVPGLGLVVLVLCLVIIGWLTPGFLGRQVIGLGERMLTGMPVIRSIYGATKQIVETVMSQQKNAFREVVLFEYPRRGSWALGFITGITEGEVQHITTDDTVNVFLPTTPNPTSGYLLFIPRKELVVLNMTVEEGIKMVISGGIVTPPDRRSLEEQDEKKVGPARRDNRTIPNTAAAVDTTSKKAS
ncbi:MAG: DUF502 domain-containing protein [Alphaproteobacteria bacterium]|nr:DUF502 domain-containing protein [Alphaproteobacteria bacterium]